MHNLYFEPDYQGVIAEMQRDLMDWLIATTRPRTSHGVNSGHSNFRAEVPSDQVVTRHKTYVLPDGKINPEWRHKARGKNYL
jgi:hypothetical protein